MPFDFKNLSPSLKSALKKAASYCAYRERCMEEVRQKLWDLSVDRDIHDEVISLLIRQDFLNEERYTKLYVRSKFVHNKWGRIKILQQLQSRNISERNISTGLSEINEEEYVQVVEQLVTKKKASLKDKNHLTRKGKIINFMRLKGFEYDIVKDFL